MKKVDLKKLALMGITGGVLLTVQSQASESTQSYDASKALAGRNGCGGAGGCGGSRAHKGPRSSANGVDNSAAGQYQRNEFIGRNIPKPMQQQQQISEQELFNSLNKEAKTMYEGLDSEGRELALELANQSCSGNNDCKGLNSCKTDENSCAGEGGCQGQSPGPFHDNNTAVKVAAKHMAEKRASLNNKKWW